MVGTPGDPVPGSTNRTLVAFAKKAPEDQSERPIYVPATEVEIQPRKAKIMGTDMDTHGATESCPGCRAHRNGKSKANHTDERRKRFEAILADTAKERPRFAAATKRRLNAITKKACEMQDAIEKTTAAGAEVSTQPAGGGVSSGSGSGLSDEQRTAGAGDQNKRDL